MVSKQKVTLPEHCFWSEGRQRIEGLRMRLRKTTAKEICPLCARKIRYRFVGKWVAVACECA